MLTTILLAAAVCAQPGVSVHLAVSQDPTEKMPSGPQPRFTSCTKCEEVSYTVAGREGKDRIDRTPILEIRASDVAESWIYVSTFLDPEKLYYSLFLFPSDDLRRKAERLVADHENERFVVFSCSEVTNFGRISSIWRKDIRAAVFESEDEARTLADRLGLKPKLIPFDREADDRKRVAYLRSWLSEFAGRPNVRESIAKEEPELFRFLERYPKYWKLLDREDGSENP